MASRANTDAPHGSPGRHASGCCCVVCVNACPHGTCGAYSNWLCRCGNCRATWTAYIRRRRKVRRRRLSDAPHGTDTGYTSWMCRCDRCRAAHAAYQRGYQQRMKAGGT